MSTQEKLLTPQELAKRWSGVVSLRTIYSWTQKPHRGPKRFSQKGDPVAYRLEDVEAFERTSLRLQLAMAKRGAQ